ncbi:MAG: A/G-specific adenine glycosylase [Longimicrobiales bacterium]|nr:A/G-specific adenine glycosylase [Longimicrobiales bacterium]
MRKENPIRNAKTLRRLLLSAYDAGKRNLPWRGETDPYRIWVSEVMLQQTRVDTVIPFYGRWMERFPDIDTLAVAEEDDVLRVWQGLGYYSRARRLQEGARVVRERYGGVIPETSEELISLPGVGAYTAGAVASIAFGESVPAVDGNVRRVLSRLFDLPNPSFAELRALAGGLMDPERPGDFNQALMELGALVCVSRSPLCDGCPLGSVCLALERGTVEERPKRKSKKPVPEMDVLVLVAVARDEAGELHFLLRKRPEKGLLAGMWEFPSVEVNGGRGISEFPAGTPAPATWIRFSAMEEVTHLFSHLKARYRPTLYLVEGREDPAGELSGCQWVSASGLGRVPLPVAQGKIARAALKTLAG